MQHLYKWLNYPWRPKFYYGWVMAPTATLCLMCTAPAQTYGFSVFTPFIRESLELSAAQLAAIYMIGTFLASLPLTWIGSFMDKHGPRLTLTILILCFIGACLALSQARGVVSLFFAILALRLFGQGSMTMLAGNTLAYWFFKRLGFVSGLKAIGGALTIAFAPRIHLMLVEAVGWRMAYVVLASMIALLLLPLMAVIYRNHPEDVGQRMDGEQEPVTLSQAASPIPPEDWSFHSVVRTRAYWIAASSIALWALVGTAVAFCAPSIYESRGFSAGASAARTALMFSAMGLTLAVGNVISGWFADFVRLHRLMTWGLLMMGGVGLLLRIPGGAWHPIAVGMSMGVCQAIMTAVGSTVWVRYFGRAALGRIRGSVMTYLVAASSAGPFLVDGVASITGGYQGVLTALMIMPLPFALVAFCWGAKPTWPQ